MILSTINMRDETTGERRHIKRVSFTHNSIITESLIVCLMLSFHFTIRDTGKALNFGKIAIPPPKKDL